MDEQTRQQFDSIFHPQSIAVVGASGDERKMGTVFLRNLLDSGFEGRVYAVDRVGGSFRGLPIYPKVSSIPAPSVDYVIVAVPRGSVLDLLDDCLVKKVKAVHFFTAGFSESGEEEGIRLEQEMVNKARKGGFRIIGPNSVGIGSPRANIWLVDFQEGAGMVSFMCQSGSLMYKAVYNANSSGLCFGKLVSVGNGCDLDSTDYLEYFAVDPETELIGAYIEGVRDGRRFFQAVKEISKKKPIVIWKGGKTEAGARAAASHTGALAASESVWSAALKQSGAIQVEGMDELTDTLLAFQRLSFLEARRITIVSGLADGGGGESVSAADVCISSGLELPSFDSGTISQLVALLGRVGSILHNPLDVCQARSMEIVQRAIEAAAADPNIDLVLIQERVDLLLSMLPPGSLNQICDMFLAIKRSQRKPVAIVLERGFAQTEWLAAVRKLSAAQIPVFPTLDRAVKAIANVNRYSSYRRVI